ncbi:TonB-dependent receptor [Chitinophaga sp. S165]|uniref:TonB-dependent receptor n=1 Tax=Chitinophaga sp. S165 TaxID=2135462 RepID=UPI000D71C66A|nr:TonB-dependent receptor [Chitinophaga sp. S165]PWV46535.1 outer membrane receptor protein involved in Fe transport [Chitinophaga sp. S165]
MRYYLTFVLLTIWFSAHAQQTNPKVSISIPATSLEAALKQLEQETSIPISFEFTRVKGFQVKAHVYKDVQLETILKELLEGTQLDFKQKGGNILITPKPRPAKTLSGFVEDAVSGEKLIGVSLVAQQQQAGTTTNNYGFYSLTVPGDSLHIQVSYIGYQRLDTVVPMNGNTHINFRLQTSRTQLGEITVSATRVTRIQESSQMSSINLPASQVRSMPRLLGEADLLKTLQLLPGVKQGTEATSALLVRGGTPDQNLILLDGAPLYNPSHLLGVFSTFNTSVLKDVTLYKGAFPARYGGRLSSVIDISTKDGDMHQLHGDFSIGLLSTQLTVEGPLKKGKTSFVVSGRRSYPDLIAGPIIKGMEDGPEKFRAFFYDLNTKIHHQFSDKDKLYLSLYVGKDKLRIRDKYSYAMNPAVDSSSTSDLDVHWGNITGTLRWNHIFSPKLFANTMLIGSSYQFNTAIYSEDKYDEEIYSNSLKLNSGIRDYGIKTDVDYRPSPAHSIKMGAAYMYRVFTPGTFRMRQTNETGVSVDTVNNNSNIKGMETDLYAEDDWEISRRLKLNAGLHWSAFSVQQRFYHSLQPRASMRFLLPGDWGLKASYTHMTQYIHLLANNSISLPTDLWVPATKKIAPQQSDQYALGISRNLFKNKFEFSTEVYYKKMYNVIEYKEGADYLTSSKGDSWQEQVTAGMGDSYGLELLLQKKTGRLTGWFGYTWAKANRRLPDVNYGRTFPYKYDRRHDLHIVTVYKLRKNIEVSGSWTYQSASPFTLPVARYEWTTGPTTPTTSPFPPTIDYISSRNNVRIQAFHRLDLGINFIKQKKNGNIRTWNISALNAYNKMNPFFYFVDKYSATTASVQLYGTILLPLTPSFSYSLKF